MEIFSQMNTGMLLLSGGSCCLYVWIMLAARDFGRSPIGWLLLSLIITPWFCALLLKVLGRKLDNTVSEETDERRWDDERSETMNDKPVRTIFISAAALLTIAAIILMAIGL